MTDIRDRQVELRGYSEKEAREEAMTDALKPTPSLLCKLGSIVVHADELLSPGGHQFDKVAFDQALNDPEVKAWLKAMGKMQMIPLKRSPQ